MKTTILAPFSLILFTLFGCESDVALPELLPPDENAPTEPFLASGEPVLEADKSQITVSFPFAPWSQISCPSKAASTGYDLAFPVVSSTSELFSPSTGIAYVHTSIPFGNHVNIEVQNGMYVVLGGFSAITATNASKVTTGQLLGSTTQTVFLGVHAGDPKQSAEFGHSLSATYLTFDKTTFQKIPRASQEILCAHPLSQNILYHTASPVAVMHPDGTLMRSVVNGKIFLFTNGKRKEVINETILKSRGYVLSDAVSASETELNCIPLDDPIDEPGFMDAVIDPSNQMWLIVGAKKDWTRYRILVQETAWEGVLDSWGLPHYSRTNPPPHVAQTDERLLWPIKKGFAHFRKGTLLREQSSEKMYVTTTDVAMHIQDETILLWLGYDPSNIVDVEKGAIKIIHKSLGSCEKNKNCLTIASALNCGW